ncbi:MAG: hypothetical protein MUF47_00550 [Porphyrobacter sp.]|jgi:hypothetical protein|nr:hypothetical protein [Porphyrobacter sp.]
MWRYAIPKLLALVMCSSCADVAPDHGTSASDSHVVEACKEWISSRADLDEGDKQDSFITKKSAACIDGEIDQEMQVRLNSWINTIPAGTRPILVIRSGGGDAYAAIDIAEALQAKDAEVYAFDICASSCANYIFSGVRRRHAIGSPALLFHGGLSKDFPQEVESEFDSFLSTPEGKSVENPTLVKNSLVEKAQEYQKRQEKLLAAAGVDPIIIHGFDKFELQDLGPENCTAEESAEIEYAFFFSEDMVTRLGIMPVSGKLEYRSGTINQKLNRSNQLSKACAAPKEFFSTTSL